MTKTRDLANLIADSKVGPSEIDTAGDYDFNRLHITNSTGLSTLSVTNNPFTVGPTNSFNLAFDPNEIQAREDGAAQNLVLQKNGGNLGIGTSAPATMVQVGDSGGTSTARQRSIRLSHQTGASSEYGGLEFYRAHNNSQKIGAAIIHDRPGTALDDSNLKFKTSSANENATTKMTLTHNGMLGIGGVSPRGSYSDLLISDTTDNAQIELYGSNTSFAISHFDNDRLGIYSNYGGSWNEYRGITIDAATGNVGLNDTNPPTNVKLAIQYDGLGIRVDGTANTERGIMLRNIGSANGYFKTDGNMRLLVEDPNRVMDFYTNNAYKMRLDSSGNLLIGTTVSNQFGNTDTADQGVSLGNGPWVSLSRNNPMFYGNRLSTNGDIFQFGYNGGLIGSLGTEGSDSIYLQGGTTGGAGLLFHGSAAKILPVRNGASIDATVDLGQASRKFKSIYAAGPLSNTYDFSTSLSRTYSGVDSYTPGSGDFIQLHNDTAAASATRYASIWAELPQYTGSSGSTRPVRFGGMSVDRNYSADFFVQTRGTNAQLTTRMTVGEEGVMREYTYNTSSNYKWWTPTSGDYQVREYDFGNRLYIKKDVSSAGYAQVVWLNRYLPAEFDMTFELKGGQTASTYRHFGIVLNGNGVANTSQWDYIVLRQHSSNSNLNTIRWDDAGVTRNSVEGSSNPNFFDGNKRRVRIEKRASSLRCEVAGLGQSPYVWGTHTGLGFTATEGGFTGFSIYENGASDTWVEISNLTITEV